MCVEMVAMEAKVKECLEMSNKSNITYEIYLSYFYQGKNISLNFRKL